MSSTAEEIRFERLERLGAGGMAVVWRALDRKLHREVALKELKEEIAFTSEGLARFRHEAEAIARLSHPNVVAFFDAAEEGPRTVLVLELVRGQPLDRLLSGGPPPLRNVVGILEKVARGVHHAHEQGVIHRDLKPSNVLVAEDGEPKVSDFGLAHLSGAMVTTLTKTGALLGTPAYMAPEQARGDRHAVDRRTDVYALGAILYEALAGAPPFRADSVHALVHEVLNREPVEPRSVRSDVPLDLQTIALKCLSKEQERRYASAAELADELRRWLDGRPILARPPSRTELVTLWVRRNRTLSVLLAALVVAVLGAVAAGGLQVREHLRRAEELRARERAVTDELERVRAAGPDESSIDRVVALDSARTVDLLERALAATTAQLASATRALYVAANELTPDEVRSGVQPIPGLVECVDRMLATGEFEEGELKLLGACTDRIEDRAVRSLPPGVDRKAADIRTLLAAEQRRRVAEGDRRVARFACEALGRLKRLTSVPPIRRYLGIIAEETDACVAGDALVRIGGPEADEALLRTSRRFGTSGLFWTRIAARLKKADPEALPGGTAPEGLTAAELKRRGVAKASTHDLDGAIADLSSSIALDPKDAYAWYNRAGVRIEKRDLDGALADASRAVKLAPSDGGFLGLRGNIRRLRGDAKGALADLERAVVLDPERPTIRIYHGQAHLALGDAGAAIAALTTALELDPKNLIALNTRGIAKKHARDPEGAIADWSRALDLDPRFAAALQNRGGLYAERGEFDKALPDLDRALEINPKMIEALGQRGRVKARQGDIEAALEDLDRAIEIAPRWPTGPWLRGQVKRDAGDSAGSIADFERAFKLSPKSGAILNDLATMRRFTGDLDGALRDYERALALEPKNPMLWMNRGITRGKKGDRKGELDDETRAIEIDPSFGPAYESRGLARARAGDKEGALQDAEHVVDLSPGEPEGWIARSVVKYLLEDYEGAVADASRALELAPRSVGALAARGRGRGRAGDRPGAIADLRRALELTPKGSNVEELRHDLAELEK